MSPLPTMKQSQCLEEIAMSFFSQKCSNIFVWEKLKYIIVSFGILSKLICSCICRNDLNAYILHSQTILPVEITLELEAKEGGRRRSLVLKFLTPSRSIDFPYKIKKNKNVIKRTLVFISEQ